MRWGWFALLALVFVGCDDDDSSADVDAAVGPDGQVSPDGGRPGDMGETADPDMGETPHPDMGPPTDELLVPGLGAPVEARFDAYGILHLKCQADDDCLAVQGYYHAAHRFVQMDVGRRFPTGRLAELVGGVVLDTDFATRHTIATRDGGSVAQQLWDTADAQTRSAIEAYTRGVNAWLADLKAGRNGAKLPDEYGFSLIGDEPRLDDWMPTDSIAATLLVVRQLTDSSGDDLFRGEMFAALPPDMAFDLYGLMPPSRSTILPREDEESASAPAQWWRMIEAHERLRPARDALAEAARRLGPRSLLGDVEFGSNNWVVGPAKSASGAALLSNDPHLGLSAPPVWYLVNIESASGLHVAGASMPGLPAVVIGQNDHIAWGFTTTFFDTADVYVETLSPDGDGVMFEGEVVPFVEREFTFERNDGDAIVQSMKYVPHHGPVLSVDAEAGTAVTMRWGAQDADTDVNYLNALARATNVTEAREAVRNLTTIGQNVVVVDRAGSVGWFPYNRVPLRPWASIELPSFLPLPGEGGAEWAGWVDYDDLPQAVDPPAGYLATANNDMTGALWDGDPANEGQLALQESTSLGYRHERIVQRLEETDEHTIDTMNSITADVRSLVGERVVPHLLEATAEVDLDEAGVRLRGVLEAWDYTCPTGLDGVDPETANPVADPDVAAASAGCTAFHVLLPRLRARTFGDELFEAGLEEGTVPGYRPLYNLLLRAPDMAIGDGWWDDVGTDGHQETRGEIVTAAMQDAGSFLTEQLGDDTGTWRWGRMHTVSLRAPLFADAGVNTYNHGPFANDGGFYTVDVASPSGSGDDSYAHRSGPSMRFACEAPADSPVRCTIQLPGGQRHFRDSPHFDDLLQKWLVNEPVPLIADVSAVEPSTFHPAP